MRKKLAELSQLQQIPVKSDGLWTLFGPPGALDAMPITHSDQIHVLDQASTQEVYDAFNRTDLLSGDDGWGNKPFAGSAFRRIETFHKWKDQDKDLKKWLYQRGIPFTSEAVLLPVYRSDDTPALVTTWKMVIKYAQDLFDWDNLVIVSNTVDWCLYYHHDGLISVGQDPEPDKWRYYS